MKFIEYDRPHVIEDMGPASLPSSGQHGIERFGGGDKDVAVRLSILSCTSTYYQELVEQRIQPAMDIIYEGAGGNNVKD
jgi:hypothetical protein